MWYSRHIPVSLSTPVDIYLRLLGLLRLWCWPLWCIYNDDNNAVKQKKVLKSLFYYHVYYGSGIPNN